VAFDIYGNSRRRSSVTMADIDSMTGLEFESFVGDLLKNLGYTGVQVTKSSGDQGVDVIASKNGKKYAIQCKNYSSSLNNKPIQEVTTGKAIYGCDVGVVLTNSTFNQNAVEAAKATGTLLWDRRTLQKMLSQSTFSKPIPPVVNSMPQVEAREPIPGTGYQIQSSTPINQNSTPQKKCRPVWLVIGIVLLVFNGLGMFTGTVASLSSGFDGADIAVLVFLFVFFLLGLFLVVRNKGGKSSSKEYYRSYEPYYGKKISWVAVGLCLCFFFPVGFYLLYKRVSQYSNSDELHLNSKTSKNWAVVFFCLGVFCIIVAIAGSAEILIAALLFTIMGIVLLKRSIMLSQLHNNLPSAQKNTAPMPNISAQQIHEPIEDIGEPDVQNGGRFSEYLYNAGSIESTHVVVHCKGCNAPNRIAKGTVVECEYCGAPVGEQSGNEPTLDNEEAAISRAFAVIQRLLESMDEVSDDLSDSFDRLTHAMETFPNRSMPLDVELNRVSVCLNNFSGEAKRISAGIRAQVMIACDNLMSYDDESWEKVETEVEKFSEIKSTLSETISSMRTFRHTVETSNVNAGFQTYKIKTAQMQLAKQIDQSLAVLQSAMADFSESIKIFRNAKFTSKTERINAQKHKGVII